jgi:hypothetical protein
MAKDDLHAEGLRKFELAVDAESENRDMAEEDIRFSRGGDQWPEEIRRQREADGRPCLTINKMPAFIRQVVNDARQNKPSIKVHPADSGADPETAEVLNGLIRNIEYMSNADVAYDTGIECAVTGGFGYWRVVTDYAYKDSFDMDLLIKRVSNPFSVYGDPNSTEADSSDWNDAFVTTLLSKDEWERKWGKKAKVSWDADGDWGGAVWRDKGSEEVLEAEWWSRSETEARVFLTSEGRVYSQDQLENDPDLQALLAAGEIQIIRERMAKTYKVVQRFMSGAEVLDEVDWPGCYIPIIPVYGDEFDIKGKRYFRSLINPAKDAQRQFNYWRTIATELVALAPKVPWIGPEGAFDVDKRWATANTESHAYLEYSKSAPAAPQRIPLDSGVAAGALQEALSASDDMKAIMGLYDASLGARSNETSGRAIMARQREGDVATFHFIDNMARAIRHTGRVLIDLIPHVYTGQRMVRVLGEDGKAETRPLNQPYEHRDEKTGQVVAAIHDLSAGKYDVTVTTGPSFTTRREEAAFQMTEMIRALPASAPVLGKHLAKNLDWPGADEIAEELEQMTSGQMPPQAQELIEQGKKQLEAQAQEIARLKEQLQAAKVDQQGRVVEAQIGAQTSQMEAEIEARTRVIVAKIEAEAKKEVEAFKAQLMARAQASRPVVQPQHAA